MATPPQLSARDMAKLGMLYLNKGQWNKRQIISSSWIEKSLTNILIQTRVDIIPFALYPFNGYGYQWWNSETAWKADLSYRKAWGLGTMK